MVLYLVYLDDRVRSYGTKAGFDCFTPRCIQVTYNVGLKSVGFWSEHHPGEQQDIAMHLYL